MPLFFWNDPDGERYRDELLRHVPRRLAPRRLDQDHRARRRRSSTAARTRPSTAAACAWAPASSTRASRACPRSPTPGGRRATGPTADRRCSSCSRRRELDDELAAEIRKRVREHCSPRHVPDAIHRIDEVPRTLSSKKLEVPVKRILQGGDPAKVGQPRLARQPRRARLVRRAGGRSSRRLRLAERRRLDRRDDAGADLGVEALDQLDAELLGALERLLLDAPRGVVEPVAAGDGDRREAGGGGGRGVAGRAADERAGVELVLGDLVAERDQLRVRAQRTRAPSRRV